MNPSENIQNVHLVELRFSYSYDIIINEIYLEHDMNTKLNSNTGNPRLLLSRTIDSIHLMFAEKKTQHFCNK